jgi:AcrR family transcriptional regulator
MTEQSRSAKSPRTYRLVARAATMDRTRERITRAAVELHGSIGPAATTMSAVADRAGVTRATLYRHFPDEEALFTACSSHWLAANPRPDFARLAAIADPAERLRRGLAELYAYYRSTERMRANLLRDIDAVPARARPGILALPGLAAAAISGDRADERADDLARDPERRLRTAVIGHAVQFEVWRSLTDQGLSDAEAANLMAHLAGCTATGEA